eukprot:4463052-Pyramimonas_sp.AAC.1
MGAVGAARHAQRISSSHFAPGAPDVPGPSDAGADRLLQRTFPGDAFDGAGAEERHSVRQAPHSLR